MKSSSILTVTALALALASAPTNADALDLGDTVDRTSKSVSKATRSVTGSVSRSVGSTTKSVTSTTRSVTSATTSAVGAAVSSGSGGTGGGSADSGGSAATVSVLSNYQLISLGLESNPPVSGTGGKQPTTVTPEYVRALVAGLDRIERQELKVRCANVLRSPKAYDSELILLCQILQSI